ncbi:hypothetical protein [Devosia sp. CAU 1758]
MTKLILPPFTPPSSLPPVGFILMLQPKKSGKSTLTDLLCSTLLSFGYDIAALRNDEHSRLERYLKSVRIELATTHDMIEGSISLDLDRHEILINLLEQLLPRPRSAVLYDSSAAAGDSLPTVLLRDLYAQILAEHDRSGVVFVPLRPTDDVAAGALYAMEAGETAMPGQLIVPVVIAQDADIASRPRGHDFFKCIERAKHGVIRLPYIPSAICGHLDRLPMPLSDLTDPTSLAVRRAVRDSLGCTQGQAGLVVAAVAEMVAIMVDELAKLDIVPLPRRQDG